MLNFINSSLLSKLTYCKQLFNFSFGNEKGVKIFTPLGYLLCFLKMQINFDRSSRGLCVCWLLNPYYNSVRISHSDELLKGYK